ncbi:MAG: cytidine deaminase [Chloroflexota bacterium]
MSPLEITAADLELIQHARNIIQQRYRPDHHHVGAAVRTRSGQIFTGVHVEANIGRVTVCAEAVAIGRAITEGAADLETIAAVRRDDQNPDLFYVVSPCGMCREMINDYIPQGYCLLVENGILTKVLVEDLLPGKYVRDACVIA